MNSYVITWKGKPHLLCGCGGPRVVVSTPAFHAGPGSVSRLGGLKEAKNVSSPSTCESQYCGEPPWPRGSVLDLRPPGFEFWILCSEDSVISIITPSSGGSPGPVYPICAQRWPKARFISFHLICCVADLCIGALARAAGCHVRQIDLW